MASDNHENIFLPSDGRTMKIFFIPSDGITLKKSCPTKSSARYLENDLIRISFIFSFG